MNQYVDAIECRRQCIKLHRGCALPILARNNDGTFTKTNPVPRRRDQNETNELEDQPKNPGGNTFNQAHTVGLTECITIPPMSQMTAPVVSTAAGLVYLEPKAAIQQRHRVRTANEVANIKTNERFAITISNFSKIPKCLPKGTVVAYTKRNPLAIHAPPEKATRTLESVLYLPFRRTEVADETDGTKPNESEPSKSPPPDWRTTVNLDRVCDAGLRKCVVEMLETYQDMWTSGRLGEISAIEHRIDLEPGTKPICPMSYRQGPTMRDKAAAELRKMLDAGVIEPATSEWASPIVLVPKKDGSLRFCVYYRRLNAMTVADAYPLPRIDDCLDSLGDSHIFTTLDCNAGYWQLPVAPEDRDKTTFTSYLGTYRYVRMPFGLWNAPATFQRGLDIILSGVRWQTCLIYLDDVIVCSRNAETHLRHVDEVLRLLRRTGVKLKLRKCSFFQPKVDYLGHVITPGTLSVAVDKAFAKAVFPRTITQLRSFLCAANAYRRFVRKYSDIARPLNLMLRKDAEPYWENPTNEQTKAFETLRAQRISPSILALPNTGRPYMIDTDASAYRLGAMLLQQ